jgi:SAM-dependent methyltransferase
MFFPEKIKSIKATDKVLEVGPGGTPHARSDVFLEKIFASEADWESQRGGTKKLDTAKQTIYYDGGKFPFKDGEFDYVICSHVIEHVEDVEFFISELFRVAKRGYLEYPTILYEYLYNFQVHLNFIKLQNGKLTYLRKIDTDLAKFLPVQKLFYHSLEMGYSKSVEDLKHVMFEGFEWNQRFEVGRALSVDELVCDRSDIPKIKENLKYGFLLSLARRIKHRYFSK